MPFLGGVLSSARCAFLFITAILQRSPVSCGGPSILGAFAIFVWKGGEGQGGGGDEAAGGGRAGADEGRGSRPARGGRQVH